MHMAAAMGTRVVAVFGVTDPVKTGPLGEGHRIVTREGTRRSRDVGRESREAEEALGSIVPAEVWNAVESAWVSG
jgi:ADP-heptose:LPS heptosyltransferase